MEPKDESSIEKLRERLHSRKGIDQNLRRRRLRKKDAMAPRAWKKNVTPPKKRSYSLLFMLLGASFVFFVLAVLVAVFVFIGNRNFVSAGNIDIEVISPLEQPAGEELSLQIIIANKNPEPILLADLIVEYPEGTRSAGDLNIALPRVRESVGTIPSGEEVSKTVNAVLFGEENSEQTIDITLEYRLENSNAIFIKEFRHEILLSSAPISIAVASLREVISNQDFVFDVDVKSNSSSVVNDVLLVADYPFGFSLDTAVPNTTFDDNVWFLGDLAPGAQKTITIRGRLQGQDQEERVFKFRAGLQSETNDDEIAASLGITNVPIVVSRPFVSLNLELNRNAAEQVVGRSGERIQGALTWTNNLSTPVNDVQIVMSLVGEALDERSVQVNNGFYRSSDNTIVWSSDTGADLDTLNPGATGELSFQFAPEQLSGNSIVRDPKILLDATITGKRFSESGVPETVVSSIKREVIVATDVSVDTGSSYADSPFINTGPLPPKANVETTYSITWTARNSSNDVTNAVMLGKLPANVRWLGQTSPASEDVRFNATTRTVTWDVGILPSRTGYSTPPREVTFQVGITPSVSQIGQIADLVVNQELSALDRFIDDTVSAVSGNVTTRIEDEAGLPSRHERVVE